MEMVGRLLNSNCEIVKNKSSEKAYQRHRKYSNIRARYNEQGLRKDSVPLLNSEKLCPTLSQYHQSGLASRFVNQDLSMSLKPATSQSMRRSYINDSPSPE